LLFVLRVQEVIKLLIWALGRLALSSASTFQHCLSILQLFEQVRWTGGTT
jgi:hypothetical protein